VKGAPALISSELLDLLEAQTLDVLLGELFDAALKGDVAAAA